MPSSLDPDVQESRSATVFILEADQNLVGLVVLVSGVPFLSWKRERLMEILVNVLKKGGRWYLLLQVRFGCQMLYCPPG